MKQQVEIQQALRDLFWVVTSPSLVASVPEGKLVDASRDSQTLARLQGIAEKPAALAEHLRCRDTLFLGSYFEALWEFWLMQQPHLHIIARRKQIHSQGKTLGEFDFVLYDHEQRRHVHQELAVKFYLGFESDCTEAAVEQSPLWYGPNANDRLDLKLRKLRDQQLRFANNTQAKAWLDSIDVQSLQVELVMKGYLFYPLKGPTAMPLSAAPDHLRGAWLYQSQVASLNGHADAWLILPKARWLSPAQAHEIQKEQQVQQEQLLSFQDLCARIQMQPQEDQRPIMVAAMRPCVQLTPAVSEPKLWVESGRFFLMPEDWPYNRVRGDQ